MIWQLWQTNFEINRVFCLVLFCYLAPNFTNLRHFTLFLYVKYISVYLYDQLLSHHFLTFPQRIHHKCLVDIIQIITEFVMNTNFPFALVRIFILTADDSFSVNIFVILNCNKNLARLLKIPKKHTFLK